MSSMKDLEFVTLDVFTTTKYSGNPLAIVTIPHGRDASQAAKQAVAREFNLSETVFLHLPAPEANTPEYVYDIFTPDKELPFAGHPTIGTACHVASVSGRRSFALLAKAGRIEVAVEAGGAARAAVTPDVRVHKTRLPVAELRKHQPALDLPDDADYPVVSFVKGMTFCLARLDSMEQLAKVQPSTVDLLEKVQLDEDFPSPELMVYFYVVKKEEVVAGDGARSWEISSRMIIKSLEDPATGSAACCLSSYLSLESVKRSNTGGTSTRLFEITQGEDMGRTSDIGVETTTDPNNVVTQAVLKGSAVPVMSGKLV